jgi:hypothetical protein
MSNTIRSLLVKVGVDLSQYNTAIDSLKSKQTEVEAKFRTSASAMDNWQTTSKGLAERVKSLNINIDAQRQIVDNLKKEYNAVVAATNADNEAAKKLNGQIIAASKTQDSMNRDLEKYRLALGEAAIAEGKTGKEAQEMGGKIKSAGASTSGLKSQLKDFASSSFGSMLTVAGGFAAAKQAIEAVARLITDSAAWADDLSALSKVTGINAQELQKLSYTARFVDVDVETMTGSMRKLTKSMYEAQQGNKDLTGIFKDQLGINIEVNGQLRDKNVVFAEAIDKLGKMTNATERDALAQKIFGKSAAELNPLILAGKDALIKYGEEAQNMGVVVDRGSIAVLNRLQDKMDQTAAVTESYGRKMAASMAPVANAFEDAWQAVLKFTSQEESMKRTAWILGYSSEQANDAVKNYNKLMEAYNVMGVSAEEFGVKLNSLVDSAMKEGKTATEALNWAIESLANGMDASALAAQKAADAQAELQAAVDESGAKLDEAVSKWRSLNDQYVSSLESTKDRISSAAGGIFDEFPKAAKTSVKKLTHVLNDNNNALKDWQKDLKKLHGKIPKELEDSLRELGPKSAGQIDALAKATPKELKKYVKVWETNNKLVTSSATTELSKLGGEVSKAYDDMKAALDDKKKKQALAESAGQIGKTIDDKINNPLRNTLSLIGRINNTKIQPNVGGVNVPKYAEGGYISSPRLAVVGDSAGGEWAIPNNASGRGLLEQANAAMGMGGGSAGNIAVEFTVNTPVFLDGTAIAQSQTKQTKIINLQTGAAVSGGM